MILWKKATFKLSSTEKLKMSEKQNGAGERGRGGIVSCLERALPNHDDSAVSRSIV